MENGNVMYVKLTGGIGNQLFQYAFGCYLSHTYQREVRYFLECGVPADAYQKLSMLLTDKLQMASPSELAHISRFYDSNRTAYRIFRRCLRAMPWLNKSVLVENGSQFNDIISPSVMLYDGYWQSFRYIDAVEHTLRSRIHFPEAIEQQLPLQTLQQTESVSIHVRFGDYLDSKNSQLFVIQDIDYYQQAIAEIKRRIPNPVFHIFSNDIDKARQMLAPLLSSPTLSSPLLSSPLLSSPPDLIDMCMMAHCKHAIISNSTFSWWAAWLSKTTDSIVIAPKKWYIPDDMNQQTKDLIPSNWIRI